MNVFLSPHDDDQTLFGAFTIMREKCPVIVVTESHIQFNRGDNITADQRWQESCDSADMLGCPILRLGLHDDVVTEEDMEDALKKYVGVFEKVYAPMLQHGNIHHDMVHNVAKKLFGDTVIEYSTYTPTVLWTIGNVEVTPTPEEIELKNKALMCHKSQFEINRIHFDAIFGKPEYLNDPSLPGYQK